MIQRALPLALVLMSPMILLGQKSATEALPAIEKLDPNMALKTATTNGIVWHNPGEAPFRLLGFPWFDSDQVYRRLPLKPDWPIRSSVDSLANCTAGGQVHFQTNSRKILLRVVLPGNSRMYHMAPTGQSGFDLYTGPPQRLRYHATTRFAADARTYEVTLLSGLQTNRNLVINFPLYNRVRSVEIGLDEGATLSAPPPFEPEGKIVVYGTSITQGGCAARPGMAYPNILSRRLNQEFVNLGFSGNGRGEPELAKLINQIPAKRMVILDYEANANAGIRETLEPFIDILRAKHPEIPILVISKIAYAKEIAAGLPRPSKLAIFQRDLVDRKRRAGDPHLYFLDGASLLGPNPDECTVDGVHPTDLGFMRMADRIEPVLRKILKR